MFSPITEAIDSLAFQIPNKTKVTEPKTINIAPYIYSHFIFLRTYWHILFFCYFFAFWRYNTAASTIVAMFYIPTNRIMKLQWFASLSVIKQTVFCGTNFSTFILQSSGTVQCEGVNASLEKKFEPQGVYWTTWREHKKYHYFFIDNTILKTKAKKVLAC